MLPDRVSNPGPLTYESGALPIALRGPALNSQAEMSLSAWVRIPTEPSWYIIYFSTAHARYERIAKILMWHNSTCLVR